MKILVVDDEWLPRGGVAKALEVLAVGAEVFEAASLSEAYGILERENSVDLVVLDLNLRETKGVETLKQLRAWCEANDQSPRIVVLSGAAEDHPELVLQVIENYGTGFIVKGTAERLFHHALSLTLDGGVYIPEAILRALAVRERPSVTPLGPPPTKNERPLNLTERECEVGALLIQGMTYKKIARELEKRDGKPVAESTIRTHVGNMAWKLGVTETSAKSGVMAEIARRELKFLPSR